MAGATDESAQPPDLPQSSDSLQLTRADQCVDQFEDEREKAQTEEEARQQIQERLPGGEEWKARIGAAGTPLEQQRVSPIVELSMLLVQCPPPPPPAPPPFPLSLPLGSSERSWYSLPLPLSCGPFPLPHFLPLPSNPALPSSLFYPLPPSCPLPGLLAAGSTNKLTPCWIAFLCTT